MKKSNRLVKKGDMTGLFALGFTEEHVKDLFEPDFCGRLGFPDYAIKNNGANIRRLKKRLEDIEAHADDETSTQTIGDIEIIDNVEDNRVQIMFPGKPSAETRKQLKARGFRWAPSVGAWQRHRNAWALQIAQEIVEKGRVT